MSDLLGAYRPGSSWLHRLPAGAKLAGLLVVSIVVMTVRGPVSGLVALVLAVGLVLWSGTRLRQLARTLRALVVVVVLLTAYLAWQGSWALAVERSTDLVALVLAATVLTATTSVDAMLDAITRLLGPWRRVGVRPERVALAFSLVLRSIPLTLQVARETRDAARARGLERDPRALLTPMVIRSVAQARATGDALHARGLGDE